MARNSAGILPTGSYLPKGAVTNADLAGWIELPAGAGAPGFLDGVDTGRLPAAMFDAFPRQEPGDAAPALALARDCLRRSRESVNGRRVDGRPPAAYDQVQRLVAASMADVYAMDSAVRWSLLGAGPADRRLERTLVRNVCTVGARRVVDRTVSLLGGEGIGTAPGEVDFRMDFTAMRQVLDRWYADPAALRPPEPAHWPGIDPAPPGTERLNLANRRHVQEAARHLRRLTGTAAELTRGHADPAELYARQEAVALLGQITGELYAVCATLGRAAQRGGTDAAAALADTYCIAAGHRLADRWRRFDAACGPSAHGTLTDRWLTGTTLDALLAPG